MAAEKYLGIDLGTTNSVAVISDGDRAEAVRTPDGGALLPSVVRIDARGTVSVGARARRFLDSDPDNARGEFKRLMGSGRTIAFRAAKLEKTPEALSAIVLAALRSAAEQVLGYAPSAAVITVPALFELPQIRATSEAASAAGFERVEHVQEPVASALTAGHGAVSERSGNAAAGAPWLVYDLGGGTFDVSLLETREGVLRVVDHDGDNFLGGRDIDARLLDLVLESLRKSSGKPLRRSDPAIGGLVRRVRAACEEAKFELGRGVDAAVSLPDPIVVDGEDILVDVGIDTKAFASLVLPLVDKSVEVCIRLLERQGVEPKALGRIVLVGGPTVMPLLRRRLEDRLGAPLATNVDPMTAVAEGAAMFAAEHGLHTRARPAAAAVPPAAIGASKAPAEASSGAPERLFLQYPSVSGDLYPYVVGKSTPGRVAKVRLERGDGEYASAEEAVDADGSFVVQVELRPRAPSTFRILGRATSGDDVLLDPNEITLRHGLSLADPPLSRTIGVALANGHVAVYFEKGAPLPSRKTFRLRTSFTVRPGNMESAISIPIVQGEIDLARLCRLVGTIEIRPSALTSSLPIGSTVDVVLDLDRGGRLTATAHLPEQNVTFPGTLALVSPEATADELDKHVRELRTKTETLYRAPYVDEAAKKKLVSVDRRLDEADRELEAARGGDADALEKLRRMCIDIDGSLADIEALRMWPELERDALDWVTSTLTAVQAYGSEVERRTLDETIRSLERAKAARNAGEFSKRLRSIRQLHATARMRDPQAVEHSFRSAAIRIGEMRDPRAARQHIADGEAALARRDTDGLRKATYGLYGLLPPDEEERVLAHGSGVEQ